MADKLLPCPFCGGEASIYHGDSTDGYIKGTSYVMAFCGWCGASIRGKNEDEAITKWNNRHSPWHTGTPTYRGRYLVSNGYDTSISYFDGKEFVKDFLGFPDVGDIIMWQKIEPYKEED